MASLLSFSSSEQHGALNLDKRLLLARGNCYYCFNLLWVCQNMRLPCQANRIRCWWLICVALTVAWPTQQSIDVCTSALRHSHMPSYIGTDSFRTWLGQYVDETAGRNKWGTNAAVVLINLWHAL